MAETRICLIGDIVVDITLKTTTTPTKMRLGGIIHAARSLWAQGIPFEVAYFAPAYLDSQIVDYLNSNGCTEITKVGNVVGAPYLFLIEEVKEAGNQGYEFILRDQIKVEYDFTAIEHFLSCDYTDCLFISGNYDINRFLKNIKGRVHIDVANNIDDFSLFSSVSRKIDTIFVSTSSTIFQNFYDNHFQDFADLFRPFTNLLILKENRGGSRGFDFDSDDYLSVGAQTQPIIHSVGVGDVYDACFVIQKNFLGVRHAMTLASWLAAEYAQTTYPDDFKTQVNRLLKANLGDLLSLGGVCVPWEQRSNIHIYIAAPDFDHVDTTFIDILYDALIYHNFNPHRPILENGQMEVGASKKRKQVLFENDMLLLDRCQILIAILLYNDPGTLIEIGISAARGLPTLVFDPYCIANNCMLTELPLIVSDDLDNIIAEVFIQSNLLLNGE